jgi:hypothetical protein
MHTRTSIKSLAALKERGFQTLPNTIFEQEVFPKASKMNMGV